MLRKFNYTDRKRIPKTCIQVKVSRANDPIPSFDARFDLSSLSLPGHARIFLEAYHRSSYMRFDYGRISDVQVPSDRRLTDIEGNGEARFRLKIVDDSAEHGRVLAEADDISPLDASAAAAGRNSILPVTDAELGDQIWRVNFNTHDGRPELELNKSIEGVKRIAESDDTFMALVYPSVIRQILQHILRNETVDLDGPADDWRVQWLRYSCSLPGIFPPPDLDAEASDNLDTRRDEWIEDVVAAFCSKHKLLDAYARAIKREDA